MNNRLLSFALLAVSIATLGNPAHADVVFDGTMGPAGSLSGNFDIPESAGTQVGSNLFHSFTTFNINTGESATFTSGFAGVTDNVISRVSGGSLSTIDGMLASTIPGAAIWLINPSGVVFGDNATLSVPGSFHISTADYLLFEDGGRFDATNLGSTVLTMANPMTFGFLGPAPAPIDAGAATISVVDGAEISLIGGDLTLNSTNLFAPAGRINLASAGSAGEFDLTANGIDVNGVTAFGNINMTAVDVDTTSDSGGDIYIRGGQFVMDAVSFVTANTDGTDPTNSGGDIVLDVDDATILNSSQISTTTFGTGDAGSVFLRASGDVLIQGDTAGFPGGIFANTRDTATGNGGDIFLSASNLSIIEGGIVGAITFGAGAAGNLDIDLTDTLYMRGTAGLFDSDILANANRSFGATGDVGTVDITATDIVMELGALVQARTIDGTGGSLTINSDTLTMTGASQMSTGTSGSGNGGSLLINTPDINISGFQFVPGFGFFVSGLFAGTSGSGNGGAIIIDAADFTLADFAIAVANVEATSTGLGGQIDVNTDRLTISFGAFISAGSFGTGESGNVNVSATESIMIDGQFLTCCNFTGIFANTFANGSAGTITVTTPELEIRDGGFIQAGSFSFDPTATGNARDITVNVDNLLLDAGFISASTWTSGNAGTVFVNASDSVTLMNTSGHIFTMGNAPIGGLLATSGAFFTSPLATGTGGDIIVNANELVVLDGGAITAQTLTAGDAGNVSINVNTLTMHSDANSFTAIQNNTSIGTGDAGSIQIDAGDMTITGLATIQAASLGFGGIGNAGSIDIFANNLTLADGGSIATVTRTVGNAGSIDIDVSGTFSASGGDLNPGVSANVSSASLGSGNGGAVRVAADNIVIDDNGIISASATSDGNGGDLIIEGRVVAVSDGSTVSANASGAGNAGTVMIIAVDDLIITNASIETSSAMSAGGNIDLQIGQTVFLNDGGTISAAAGGVTATDDGGNISIDRPVFVILREGSILATANAGNGGNIDITANSFIVDLSSVIDASSQTGLDGRIRIEAVNNIYGSVLLLEAPSIEAPDVLTQRCVAAAFQDRSSLTVEQQNERVWSPEDFVPSPLSNENLPRRAMSSLQECGFTLVPGSGVDAS